MDTNRQLSRLLEPARIGQMDLRNRMVMPPMGTFLKAEGRHGVDRHTAYYEARAKGGVGLVIVEATAIDYPRARYKNEQLSADDDKYVPGLSEIAEAIRKHGAKAAVQLHHPGVAAPSSITGVQPVGPSAVSRPGYEPVKELTVSEIAEIVALYATAAERARKAGFDGVEISAHSRYLIPSFLSSVWNKRQDDYGGSLENRTRFLLEIIKAIRERVGASYPLWCRLNGREYGIEGGLTVEEAQQIAVMAQRAGTDAVHVSASPPLMPYHAQDVVAATMPPYGPGCFVPLAEAIHKAVTVPVIAVGRIDPRLGEKVLRQGKADLIAMGRPLIADPELPNKVASGSLEDIAPCVYCSNCMSPFLPRECTVNAARGKERESVIVPAERTKRVLVVGGGPAGMEAARVAALRGHEVLLYEKGRRLGGQLVLASVVRAEYESVTRYLSTQIKKLGVSVEVGKPVTPALVQSLNPDAVIVATGPVPRAPEIPGIGADNVMAATGVSLADHGGGKPGGWLRPARWRKTMWHLGLALLSRPALAWIARRFVNLDVPLGRRVVIVGGGLPGLELAEFLAHKGKRVTIVDSRQSVSGGPRPMYLLSQFLFHELGGRGVEMLAGATYEQVTNAGLVVTTSQGERRLLPADAIVLAGGAQANPELVKALEGKVPEVYAAGDSEEPCGICEAIAAGSRVGRAL